MACMSVADAKKDLSNRIAVATWMRKEKAVVDYYQHVTALPLSQ